MSSTTRTARPAGLDGLLAHIARRIEQIEAGAAAGHDGPTARAGQGATPSPRPARPDALDHRLLSAGLAVTVAQLTDVLWDHWPYDGPRETWDRCPGCGHIYTEAAPECPTAAVARPLLARRRHEDIRSVEARFTSADLSRPVAASCPVRTPERPRAAAATPASTPDVPTLF